MGRHDDEAPNGCESFDDSLTTDTLRSALGIVNVGDEFDSYRIVEHIGEGAFGEVYLAEQLKPVRRRVALKILKAGMDSRRILGRFRLERQSLALMDHPSIAKVFDAGTTPSGRPYFVMQYVQGVPITQYCDDHRLSVQARLDLFCSVCTAIQHAHHKGVIHRDLKPSNILVSTANDFPLPMVIDFGIAKATDLRLASQTLYTERGQWVGTPAYMAPEQTAAGEEDVDTRSDVYSLGVLLYQLLIGVLPFDPSSWASAGIDEVARLIRHVDPPTPPARYRQLPDTSERVEIARRRGENERGLVKSLERDLSWIVMKCLEKERVRRYSTASELAADVERFLSLQPVLARPPSIPYVLKKFLRRRTGLVVASAAVLIVAAVGLSVSSILGNRLLQEREFNRAQRVEQMLADARMLAEYDPLGAVALFREAAELSPEDPDVARERAYMRALAGRSELAIEGLRELVASDPTDGESAAMLSGLLSEDDPEEAARYRSTAMEVLDLAQFFLFSALATRNDLEAIHLLDCSLALANWNYDAVWQRGVHLYNTGQLEQALLDANELVRNGRDRAAGYSLLGSIQAELKHDEAIGNLTRAVELEPNRLAHYYNRAWTYTQRREYEQALPDALHLAQFDNLTNEMHDIAGRIFRNNGMAEHALHHLTHAIDNGYDDSRTLYERAMAHADLREWDRVIKDTDAGLAQRPNHVSMLRLRGRALAYSRRLEDAEADLRTAMELAPERDLNHALLGWVLRLQGKTVEALLALDHAVEMRPEEPGHRTYRAVARLTSGDLAGAASDLEAAVDTPGNEWVALWLWDLHTRLGDPQAASGWLREAEDRLSGSPAQDLIAAIRSPAPTELRALGAMTDEEKHHWYYFQGILAELRGRELEASQYYEAVVDLSLMHLLEYEVAQWRLATVVSE